jgi:hypothetical protein
MSHLNNEAFVLPSNPNGIAPMMQIEAWTDNATPLSCAKALMKL